jgi:hypothetical protein
MTFTSLFKKKKSDKKVLYSLFSSLDIEVAFTAFRLMSISSLALKLKQKNQIF